MRDLQLAFGAGNIIRLTDEWLLTYSEVNPNRETGACEGVLILVPTSPRTKLLAVNNKRKALTDAGYSEDEAELLMHLPITFTKKISLYVPLRGVLASSAITNAYLNHPCLKDPNRIGENYDDSIGNKKWYEQYSPLIVDFRLSYKLHTFLAKIVYVLETKTVIQDNSYNRQLKAA
jgi:hypothetical protein